MKRTPAEIGKQNFIYLNLLVRVFAKKFFKRKSKIKRQRSEMCFLLDYLFLDSSVFSVMKRVT